VNPDDTFQPHFPNIAGRSGFDSQQRLGIFLFATCPDRLWDPPSILYNGFQGAPWESSGRSVKLITHLHLAPRIGTRGAISPIPHHVFIAWCLIKHRGNFTFTFTIPILSSHLRLSLPRGLFLSSFPTKTHWIYVSRKTYCSLKYDVLGAFNAWRAFELNAKYFLHLIFARNAQTERIIGKSCLHISSSVILPACFIVETNSYLSMKSDIGNLHKNLLRELNFASSRCRYNPNFTRIKKFY
jgi:hypothetical protein